MKYLDLTQTIRLEEIWKDDYLLKISIAFPASDSDSPVSTIDSLDTANLYIGMSLSDDPADAQGAVSCRRQ